MQFVSLSIYTLIQIERVKHLEKVKQDAAVTVQAYWRGYSVQRIYHNKLMQLRQQRAFRAAQLVQSRWRGFSVRRDYGPILKARREMRKEKDRMSRYQCAAKLQALWRGYYVRCIHRPWLTVLREKRTQEALKMKHEMGKKFNLMATLLQAVWRGYVVRKKYGPMLSKMEQWRKEISCKRYSAAARIQACWRGHSVRQRVRLQLLEWRNERRALEEQQEKAALVLQAHWRGHVTRARHSEGLKQTANQSLIEEVQCSSTLNAASEVTQSKGNEVQSAQYSIHCSAKLTVTKRLQSALKLRSQKGVQDDDIVTDVRSEYSTSQAAVIHVADVSWVVSSGESSTSEEEGEAGKEGKIMRERQAMTSLVASRHWEEGLTQQSKIKMSNAVPYWEAEKVVYPCVVCSCIVLKLCTYVCTCAFVNVCR